MPTRQPTTTARVATERATTGRVTVANDGTLLAPRSAPTLAGTVEHHSRGTLVRVGGTLHGDTALVLRRVVLDALADRPKWVVLDVEAMVTGDDRGLHVLPVLAEDARRAGATITVVAGSSQLRTQVRLVSGHCVTLAACMPELGERLSPPTVAGQLSRFPRRSRPTNRDGPPGARTAKPTANPLLEAVFSLYGEAISRGDSLSASRYYAVPTYVATPGAVGTITNRGDIEASLADLCAAYRARGLSWARPRLETALEIGPGHWQTTVSWCHCGPDDPPPVYARYRYLVRRSPTPPRAGPRAQITSVTVLNAPSTVAPEQA